jgi:L-lactate dehydrogenase complex protein LldG
VADARTEIMERIRAALRDRPVPPPVPRGYRRGPDEGTDVVALFAERAGDYRAVVEVVDTAALPGAVAAALAARQVADLVVPPGVPGEWLTATGARRLPDEPPLSVRDLDAAHGVITAAAVAIALTGTVVLDAGPGQGRRALSLLPDFHLCVVRADQIVATVSEGLARLDPRRPLTWISGPSATSDIELNRVEGVHGPRNLHILVVT